MINPLLPFSWLYCAGMAIRNTGFDRGWWVSQDLPCLVISIGNLTVGGTGKTPMVIALAEKLRQMNYRVGIVSLGYRRKSRGTVVISNGHKTLVGYEEAGDEPALMASRLSGVPIIVDKMRIRGGQALIKQFNPDIILLDDGFQYRWLYRDLDIVLLDAKRPFSNGHLLPAGRLREPIKNLKRADVIIFTRTSDKFPTMEIIERINSITKAPILKSIHRAVEWVSLDGERRPIDSKPFTPQPLLLSGIVHPDDFEATVRSIGTHPIAHLTFPDHQHYGVHELERIAELYRTLKADAILTTEKDLVKLPKLLQALRVWALRIELEITEGEPVLLQMIQDKINEK
jgi:tetraacyldisaccharide 4'-kinase